MPIRLSAVIPTWNCAPFLGDAIESVLAQRDAAVEVIVVDDGSTDETPGIVASFGGHVRALRQENRGLPAARNAGIALARGELIGFLDADDTWEEEKSRRQIDYLDVHPTCGLVFCDVWRMDETGRRGDRILGSSAASVPTGRCLEALFLGNFILVPGVVVRRSVLDRVGPFDESLLSVEDYDMWLRIASVSEIGIVPEPLASWRERSGQMSRSRDRVLACESVVLERALRRIPGLRASLGSRARRRLANLWDEHGWWDLHEGRLAPAVAKFVRALRRDPLWEKPYRHLLAAAFAAAGIGRFAESPRDKTED